MLEFSVSNQLLSRLDATKVVADSENYLECVFQFSEDWDGTVAVATFGHSKVNDPIPVRIVDGTCRVPHEVIKSYGFQLAVYGTVEEGTGEMCHIPTNAVTVEVEASGTGSGLTPAEPTKSLYDSLMTAISEGEAAAVEAKVSARASAEAALGAQTGADAAKDTAQVAAGNAAISATSCATDAQLARDAWDEVMAARDKILALSELHQGYVFGGEEERQLMLAQNIDWEDGAHKVNWPRLEAGERYRVRVDDVWYDAAPQWELVKRSVVKFGNQAELFGQEETDGEQVQSRSRELGGEIPEIPKGEEALEPGGDGDGTIGGIPVVKPTVGYEVVKDIIRLTAGPVTVESVYRDMETGERQTGHLYTIDSTVREVEIRTGGAFGGRHFYEQAMAAAARAEAALRKMEGWIQ